MSVALIVSLISLLVSFVAVFTNLAATWDAWYDRKGYYLSARALGMSRRKSFEFFRRKENPTATLAAVEQIRKMRKGR